VQNLFPIVTEEQSLKEFKDRVLRIIPESRQVMQERTMTVI